ncbi:MAG: response regulator [Candidatus Riflebacteria bacterium]|nr:response regulator [Candidatus Riflebacteria bacterium]
MSGSRSFRRNLLMLSLAAVLPVITLLVLVSRWQLHTDIVNIAKESAEEELHTAASQLEMNQDLLWLILGVLLSIMMSVAIVWFGSRKVTQPLMDLAEAVVRFRNGEWQARISNPSNDEVGQVAVVFNTLAEEVSRQRQDLEARVTERTTDLEQARKAALSLMQDADLQRRTVENALKDLAKSTQSINLLSRAVENTAATVVITNADGIIEYVNQAFCQVTGYSREEAIGNNPRILQSGIHNLEFYQNLWNTILSGKTWSGRLCNKKKSGELMWESVKIAPVTGQDGRISHFVAVKEEITEMLATQVILEKAKLAAEAANIAKGQFLANMSHEIRTPMNAILGFSHLALKMDMPPKLFDYIAKINSAGNAVLGLINDILDLSKIEAGKLELEKVAFVFDNLMNNVASIVSEKAASKELSFHIQISSEIPQSLIGDQLRLAQILINLTTNAIKFTEKGEIELSIKLLEKTENRGKILFEVRDTGIGMNRQQQNRLFLPFSQADGSTTRKYGGTGLGLSICKHLVEMMEGRISVQSEPGRGSTFSFWVWFDLGPGENIQERTTLVDHPSADELKLSLEGAHVLLAEDNSINQEIAVELLQELGITVEVANDGRQAVDKIMNSRRPYDFILMDIQMPEMDGIEATKLLRKNPRFDSIPIIAMTAHALTEEKNMFLEVGMNDHILKPIVPKEMSMTLKRWYHRSAQPQRSPPDKSLRFSQSDDFDIPAISGINMAAGLQRVRGKKRLYLNLLHRFVESQTETAARISEAIERGDFESSKRLAHTLRGVAGNLGAEEIHEIAQELEQAIINSEADDKIRKLCARLGEALKLLIRNTRIVRKRIANMSAAAISIPVDLSALLPELSALAEYLKKSNVKSLDTFRKLRDDLVRVAPSDEFSRLEKNISIGDFDEAVICLEDLMIGLKEGMQ